MDYVRLITKWIKPALWLLLFPGLNGCLFDSTPEGMVLVPEGEFVMGTDAVDRENDALRLGLKKPWYADESPAHKVFVKAFYIDKYEVTNRDYYIFCLATGHKPPRLWGGPKYPDGKDFFPVTHVNFYDAAAYAEWAGKRLPNEAQWEKAARGLDNFIYPWGNEFSPTAANISPSAKKKHGHGLQPVGSHLEGISFHGAHDMIGNAWEWVWDYYLPYAGNKYETGDYGKKNVVVRGLSYLGVGHFPKKDYRKVIALMARASYREKMNPFSRKKDVGFRCVKEKPSLYERLMGKRPVS